MANAKYYGTGRRKKSVARVYLVPGTGKITINKRDIDEYLGLETKSLICGILSTSCFRQGKIQSFARLILSAEKRCMQI